MPTSPSHVTPSFHNQVSDSLVIRNKTDITALAALNEH